MAASAPDLPTALPNGLRLVLAGLLFAGIAALVWWLVPAAGPMSRPIERRITRIELPPPPPPPPPPEPKPIEPPKEIFEPTPTDKPPSPEKKSDDAPALTTAGPPGEDAFGAVAGTGSGAGNRIGGCLGDNCGDGLGGGGLGFGEYNSAMSSVVQRALQRERKARGRYEVVASVSLGPGGEIISARLAETTGDPARDAAVEAALIGLRPDRPLSSVPQYATIRVNVRLRG
jgi:periplasmic protein TonB